MKSDFAGRVAILVGVADEPGPAMAHALARSGATVVLMDTASEQLNKVVKNLSDAGGAISVEQLGSNSTNAIQEAVGNVQKNHGRIDILINMVRTSAPQPMETLAPEKLRDAVEAAVLTPFSSLHSVVPVMRERGYGRIINVSRLEYLGLPGKVGLAAAHASIFGMTRAAALEVARDNITVNNLVIGDVAPSGMLTDEEVAEITKAIPVKRVGGPDDVAHAVMFFADEKAKYVTGQTFFVCGGKSAYFSMSI